MAGAAPVTFGFNYANELQLSNDGDGVAQAKYSYNTSWLGRPIIQYPQDIVAMQELIWSLRPDLIIETGIAHGGSLICTGLPLRSMTWSIGVGGHQVPPLMIVASTFANSSVLVGAWSAPLISSA